MAHLRDALPRPGPRLAPATRIVLYSHDTMGLGHVRRNLAIARGVAEADFDASTLLICGAREAGALAMPPGVDCVTLPGLRKELGGQYDARSLDVTLRELIELRSRAIDSVIASFRPDVLVVDNVPRGACGELERTLVRLRREGRTRCVLGLRDVLDDAAAVRQEWHTRGNRAAIAAWYDAVWIYGDPRLLDPVVEYDLGPEVAAKARYVGYLDRTMAPRPRQEVAVPGAPFALCLVGGGQDGFEVADAFARARMADGLQRVLVTGPFMPADLRSTLEGLAAADPTLTVHAFVDEPTALIARAEAVVCMGGYNTVNEVLSYRSRALVVPRVAPRLEQLVRATRLRDLGLVDMLLPAELTPAAVAGWLSRRHLPPRPAHRLDLDGLRRIPQLLLDLVGGCPSARLPLAPVALPAPRSAVNASC
ncbi:membrane protein [Luteitalea sp. TBR-22]|uniref:glycosyltransferase family protein n=1 Tax=Luteitalea sp. TBR-22 TaxID=2802971 RepID=UPI001AF30064|nr:glycosyltransferase [Luteitalea sp. TBR-22]BCS34824.1 membrane protein [Luteitalea sp. TBR-22]